jgi:hypothetical protein
MSSTNERISHPPAEWNLFQDESTYDELVGHFIRNGKHTMEAFECADAMWKKMTGKTPTQTSYDKDFLDSNNTKRYEAEDFENSSQRGRRDSDVGRDRGRRVSLSPPRRQKHDKYSSARDASPRRTKYDDDYDTFLTADLRDALDDPPRSARDDASSSSHYRGRNTHTNHPGKSSRREDEFSSRRRSPSPPPRRNRGHTSYDDHSNYPSRFSRRQRDISPEPTSRDRAPRHNNRDEDLDRIRANLSSYKQGKESADYDAKPSYSSSRYGESDRGQDYSTRPPDVYDGAPGRRERDRSLPRGVRHLRASVRIPSRDRGYGRERVERSSPMDRDAYTGRSRAERYHY